MKGIKAKIIKVNFQSKIKPMTNAVINDPNVLIIAPKIVNIKETYLHCVCRSFC